MTRVRILHVAHVVGRCVPDKSPVLVVRNPRKALAMSEMTAADVFALAPDKHEPKVLSVEDALTYLRAARMIGGKGNNAASWMEVCLIATVVELSADLARLRVERDAEHAEAEHYRIEASNAYLAVENAQEDRAEDRAAIREASNLMDRNSSWHRTHAPAIARATQEPGR